MGVRRLCSKNGMRRLCDISSHRKMSKNVKTPWSFENPHEMNRFDNAFLWHTIHARSTVKSVEDFALHSSNNDRDMMSRSVFYRWCCFYQDLISSSLRFRCQLWISAADQLRRGTADGRWDILQGTSPLRMRGQLYAHWVDRFDLRRGQHLEQYHTVLPAEGMPASRGTPKRRYCRGKLFVGPRADVCV